MLYNTKPQSSTHNIDNTVLRSTSWHFKILNAQQTQYYKTGKVKPVWQYHADSLTSDLTRGVTIWPYIDRIDREGPQYV